MSCHKTEDGCPKPYLLAQHYLPSAICEDEEKQILEEARMIDDQNVKQDAGKLKLSLVPFSLIKEVAKCREYGQKKYGEHSERWRECKPERIFDACLRHLYAHSTGEIYDKESGLKHLSHAATNIAFMLEITD